MGKKKEKNVIDEKLYKQSKLMICVFTFIGVAMVAVILLSTAVNKGTYSAETGCSCSLGDDIASQVLCEQYGGTWTCQATTTCASLGGHSTCDHSKYHCQKITAASDQPCYANLGCLEGRVDYPNCVLPGSSCGGGNIYNNDGKCCKYITMEDCKAGEKGYNCSKDSNNCYVKSSSACFACVNPKDGKTYYTYTNEGRCPLANSYDDCAGDTHGKNRLYLYQHDVDTGAKYLVNVIECNYDAIEECKVSPGGTWYHEKECIRNVGQTTNVTINGDTIWWQCVGGGNTPTPACYLVNHKYVWATEKPTGGVKVTTVTTEAECKGCEDGYEEVNGTCVEPSSPTENPTLKPNYACYLVNHKYVWATEKPTGGTLVTTITTSDECDGCVDGYEEMNGTCVEPSNPTKTPVKSCYTCTLNGKTQSVYATSTTEAAKGATTLKGVTASNCKAVSDDYCKAIKQNNCYECKETGKNNKYVTAYDEAEAKTKSSYTTCSIVTSNKCNTPTNPQTGTIYIVLAWIIGILTIGYSFWYFRKSLLIK